MKRTRNVILAALMAVVLVASKAALDALPNIELVSLLVILYTLEYPKLVLPAVYVYAVLYGLFFGFGIWWIPQMYVWAVLVLAAWLLRGMESPLAWALVSGVYGLFYGVLYALSYGVMNGLAAGLAWWVTGIPFDLLHGAGNFVVALVLFQPLRRGLQRTHAFQKSL